MKKFSKILSLAMVLVMCASVFAGCGEKVPTAEELVDGAFGKDAIESLSATVSANIELSIDLSSLGAEEAMNMACSMAVDMDVDKDGDVHTAGSMGYEVFGITGEEKVDTYEIAGEDGFKTYAYDAESDSWTVDTAEEGSGKEFIATVKAMANSKAFKEGTLTLAEIKEGDATYTVNGTIDASKFGDNPLAGLLGEEIGSSVSAESLEGLYFDMTMQFDKETKNLMSVELKMNVENATEEIKAAFKDITMTVVINQINGVEVDVPANVVEAAVDANKVVDVEEMPAIDDVVMPDIFNIEGAEDAEGTEATEAEATEETAG